MTHSAAIWSASLLALALGATAAGCSSKRAMPNQSASATPAQTPNAFIAPPAPPSPLPMPYPDNSFKARVVAPSQASGKRPPGEQLIAK